MRLAGRQLRGPLVLAGVGNRERADDGFGPALACRLLIHGWKDAIDCGDRLEDFTADIAAREPRTILVADAVEMRARPGEIALLDVSKLPWACHAHAPSLRTAMEYLRARTGAEVLLLGVQPGRIGEGFGLSREVAAALNAIVDTLTASPTPAGENSDGKTGQKKGTVYSIPIFKRKKGTGNSIPIFKDRLQPENRKEGIESPVPFFPFGS